VREGDVIRIDDRLTGFDDNKLGRPYCVVRVIGDRWREIYVVPRTTEQTRGAVKLEAGVVATLNQTGWFLFRGYRLEPADIEGVEPVGALPAAVLTRVQDQANLAEFDID
jgi:hypothetical protein